MIGLEHVGMQLPLKNTKNTLLLWELNVDKIEKIRKS